MGDRLPAYPTPQETFGAPTSMHRPGASNNGGHYHSSHPRRPAPQGQPSHAGLNPSSFNQFPQQLNPYSQQTHRPLQQQASRQPVSRPPPPQQQHSQHSQHSYQQPQQPPQRQPPPQQSYAPQQSSRVPLLLLQQPPPPQHNPLYVLQSHGSYLQTLLGRTLPQRRTTDVSTTLSSSGGVEQQLRDMFNRYDVGRNGLLDETELLNALVNFDRLRFKQLTIKLMMKSFDSNGLGTLEFLEFQRLWLYLSSYSKLFQEADSDRLMTILFGEYQNIVQKIGYDLPTDTVLVMFTRFSSSPDVGIPHLKFDAFIELLFHLRKITDSFRKYDRESQGIALIKFQDFINEVLLLRI